MDVNIREERPQDLDNVLTLIRKAFGREEEAELYAKLHASGRGVISLVAEAGEQIIGQILFTPLGLAGYAPPRQPDALPENIPHAGSTHLPKPWAEVTPGSLCLLALAPVSVLPAVQGKGLGSALIRQGLVAAGPLIWAAGVVVLGHADYYPRFGFVPASRFGISCPLPVPEENFMALELDPGSLENKRGTVIYAPEFGL